MSDETEKRGRGRPETVKNGYNSRSNLRLSDDEIDMLNSLSIEKGINMSTAFRKGLGMLYNLEMNRR